MKRAGTREAQAPIAPRKRGRWSLVALQLHLYTLSRTTRQPGSSHCVTAYALFTDPDTGDSSPPLQTRRTTP
ncbi:hypothetical protein PsYK624_100470 [Phanerochaete sordida]|uniref:Uncharacterized protein n=1 Tax=Phanerochaete sordida TaxID=48140 RepID=A0A9P3LH92_9APHY|nr:hypothetical protein PsYK624_100470 [Phanerochaete sordida]